MKSKSCAQGKPESQIFPRQGNYIQNIWEQCHDTNMWKMTKPWKESDYDTSTKKLRGKKHYTKPTQYTANPLQE